MGQRLTVRRLEEIQRLYLLDMLFLVETKQQDNYIRDKGVSLGFSDMCIVSPRGLSGGLAVFWKNHVSVQVISQDVRLVDLYVEYKSFNFYLSCIYGHPIPSERHHLWEKLQRISTNRNGPWMMCGDFNEILQPEEKQGGRQRSFSSLRNFTTMIDCCNMQDLKFKGNPFSWVGKRQKETIQSCLDRVFINSDWKASYPASETEFLTIAGSYHAPVIITVEEEFCVKRGQFRYDKRHVDSEDFVRAVKKGWSTELSRWKRRSKTNSAEKIQILKAQLDVAERSNSTTLAEVTNLRYELTKAYSEEEQYWKLKSRNQWMNLGDRNTKFFYATTKIQKARNRLKSIFDEQGVENFRDDAIGKVAESYFTKLFTTTQHTNMDDIISDIEPRVTAEMNRDLQLPVIDQEIKDAVFSIGADRDPGSDGFTAAFYQQFWELIGDDVCSMAAFFPGRSISDNILVAHELLHSLKSRRDFHTGYVAIKTDISKAYDRVEWNFLEAVMTQMGFAPRWVKWIMECVTSVSYEVLINGSPYGKIKPSRGIRQGDPLSPYLFLFCAEVLSNMMQKAERDRQIHGIRLARDCPSISHLLFADDSLFFCRSSNQECEHIASIFKRYEAASGQQINYTKSSVIFGFKTPDSRRQRIHQILGIERVGGGGKYLGLPEQFGRKKVELFEYIVQRVKERTEGWNYKHLSAAGKEIVIKTIAMALPVFSMNCFLLPITICNEITIVVSNFWWGQDNGKRKIPWTAWKRLTLPKKEGGLGFKDLQAFNKALLAKQAERLLKNPYSLLARLYKGLYYPDTPFLQTQTGPTASSG
ncbi:PREDICTED: uncharacterized protein LOC109132875 [Camelina sativa]|uniref:Uncharacterized protein LOC109132875 n=1 Tax=Camelina sativa TaxID=90675 RepID=A0ABM1RPD1_CAMSA|nr:PREDICTED: uncharacterized protein LOC109132875 [Camelina sativa]